METKYLTKPFINVNGNDKNTLAAELNDTVKAFDNLIDKVSSCQFSHGRNSTDLEHAKQMRSERQEVIESLQAMREQHLNLLKEIKNK